MNKLELREVGSRLHPDKALVDLVVAVSGGIENGGYDVNQTYIRDAQRITRWASFVNQTSTWAYIDLGADTMVAISNNIENCRDCVYRREERSRFRRRHL